MDTNYKNHLICLKKKIKRKFVDDLRLLVIQYNDIDSDSEDELLIIPEQKVEYIPMITEYDDIDELNTAFDDTNRSKQLIVIDVLLENLVESLGLIIK